MNDNEIQKLIEASLKESSDIIRSNKQEQLYQSLFNELNTEQELPIPYQFSNKVTREAMKIQANKETYFTKIKIAILILASLLFAGLIFKIFKVNIDFITTIPVSYFIYGLGAVMIFIIIELADYFLLKKY